MTYRRMSKRLVSLAAALALSLATAAPVSAADDRVVVIRDAEIEATIRAYAAPLFQAAGLAPDDIHVILVQSDKINAYVTHGLNLVLYTGLLIRSETAGQVIGVIAHETGHIAGGHLARLREEVDTLLLKSLAVAALASPRPSPAASPTPPASSSVPAATCCCATSCATAAPRNRRPTTPASDSSTPPVSRAAACCAFSRSCRPRNSC